MKQDRIVGPLLRWFAQNARDLPWRRTRDPYAIWVSEIMLQQTQVQTVLPYWERWMKALPTIAALAGASPSKVHKLWEGLGYYSRVRNLQRAAQIIVLEHGGTFPRDFEKTLALPGIGRYTAGAIASIAFDQPRPILDGNVMRVLARCFGVAGNPRLAHTNAKLWEIAEQLVGRASQFGDEESKPEGRNPKSERPQFAKRTVLSGHPFRGGLGKPHPKSEIRNLNLEKAGAHPKRGACSRFNQALMELGALVCTPRQPRCGACPLAKHCIAYREGRIEELPGVARRAPATRRRFVAFVIEKRGRFLVRQRPHGVVNGHLWEFPNTELEEGAIRNPKAEIRRGRAEAALWRAAKAEKKSEGRNPKEGASVRTLRRDSTMAALGESGANGLAGRGSTSMTPGLEPLCTIKHTITRYRITLEVFRAVRDHPLPPWSCEGRWLLRPQLDELAFAAAHKKILRHL